MEYVSGKAASNYMYPNRQTWILRIFLLKPGEQDLNFWSFSYYFLFHLFLRTHMGKLIYCSRKNKNTSSVFQKQIKRMTKWNMQIMFTVVFTVFREDWTTQSAADCVNN